MKFILLEKRLGRWIYRRALKLWATGAATVAAAGFIWAAFAGLDGFGCQLAAAAGVFLLWAAYVGMVWCDAGAK